MINLLWSGIVIALMVSGCGWNGTPTRINDITPLTSIEISADSPTIIAKSSTKLSVKGNFSGLFTRDVTDQVVWSNSAPTVAGFSTAESPNRVTGIAPGTATLTATVGSVSSTYSLTVSSATVTALTITPVDPSIAKGRTIQFVATGTLSDLKTLVLTEDVNWASSDTAVATVSDAAGNKGFVQALTAGTSTITASFDTASGNTLLTVTEPVLQSIAVTPANPSILTLSTRKFTATGTYSDGTTPDITSQVTWDSSNTAIATIDAGSGTATTLAQGTTTIRASLGSINGTTALKATGGNLTGFTVSPATVILVKDTTRRISASGTFSNSSVRDITGAVQWSAANSSLASVTTPGGNLAWLNPLAVTPSTIISAASDSLPSLTPATATLTVTAPVLQSIAIVPPVGFVDLTVGTSAPDPFTVNATFSDGTTQDVTANAEWTSSVPAAASVENSVLADKGRVTGVAAGVTTVGASYGGKTAPNPATITVRSRILQSLTISGPSGVAAGNQVPFKAMANYSDGTTVDVTKVKTTAWAFETANDNVAIFADSTNQPGEVVGVDSGSITLTAKFGDKTQTLKITVTSP